MRIQHASSRSIALAVALMGLTGLLLHCKPLAKKDQGTNSSSDKKAKKPSGPAGAVLAILDQLQFGKTGEAEIIALLTKWKVRFKRELETEPPGVEFSMSDGPRKRPQVLPAKAHYIAIRLLVRGKAPARLSEFKLARPPFGPSICQALTPYYRSRAQPKGRCRFHRDKKDDWSFCLLQPNKQHVLVVRCSYSKKTGDGLEVFRTTRG